MVAFAAGALVILLKLAANAVEIGGFLTMLVLPAVVLGAGAWLALRDLVLGNARAAVIAATFGLAAGLGAGVAGAVVNIATSTPLARPGMDGLAMWIFASLASLVVLRGLVRAARATR